MQYAMDNNSIMLHFRFLEHQNLCINLPRRLHLLGDPYWSFAPGPLNACMHNMQRKS